MKRIIKCCLEIALGLFAVAGCSKEPSGGSGGSGGDGITSRFDKHKGVQLWKDGPYWAETNIGAERPWQFGYYFWWGATSGYNRYKDVWVTSDGSSSNFAFYVKHALTMNTDESTLRKEGWISSDGALTPKHDAAHVLWGGNWRMPTSAELQKLCEECDWTRTFMCGFPGHLIKGKGDYASAQIFLPAAGYGDGTSQIGTIWKGYYWSSSSVGCDYAFFFYFDSGDICGVRGDLSRYHGMPIRPVKNP